MLLLWSNFYMSVVRLCLYTQVNAGDKAERPRIP